MRQRVLVVIALFALGLFAGMPALADTIDFNATGAGGTWVFSGSSPLSLAADFVEVDANGGTYSLLGSSPTETFTTGAFLGGTGTSSDPWSFAPSVAGSYVIMGCVPPATSGCSNQILFSGDISGAELLFQSATSGLAFIGLDVVGTLNPGLTAFLGVASGTYTGVVTFNLSGQPPNGGRVESGDLTLTSTVKTGGSPEPASLMLLGSGLVALAGLARLRKRQTRA